MCGNLYRAKPELRDAGFNIYYMGVNVGATLGPASQPYSASCITIIRISFWAAAIGMILSLIIMHFGKKNLIEVDTKQSTDFQAEATAQAITMDPREFWQRIMTLCALFFIAALFWVPFYQNGMALTLFADRSTVAYKFLRPETYLIFNAFFILILTPPLLALFSRLRNLQPGAVHAGQDFLGSS